MLYAARMLVSGTSEDFRTIRRVTKQLASSLISETLLVVFDALIRWRSATSRIWCMEFKMALLDVPFRLPVVLLPVLRGAGTVPARDRRQQRLVPEKDARGRVQIWIPYRFGPANGKQPNSNTVSRPLKETCHLYNGKLNRDCSFVAHDRKPCTVPSFHLKFPTFGAIECFSFKVTLSCA